MNNNEKRADSPRNMLADDVRVNHPSLRLLRRRQFRRFISCKSPSSRHVSPLMLG